MHPQLSTGDSVPSTACRGRRCWVGVILALLLVVLGATSSGVLGNGKTRRGAVAEVTAPAAANGTTFRRTTISIPTYPYADYLEEAHDPTYNITYPVLDWDRYTASNPTAAPQDYELLVLENPYLEVTLLPELGGRVYQLIDRETGHNHFYQNPVIKPTYWGPPEQGWWLSVGGLEWCLPVDEHGYEWGIPWSWSVLTSTAGVTVTVQDTTATDRLRASVDVFLPSDRAVLIVQPHIENPTLAPIDYKFWSNASIAPGAANTPTEGLRFIFNSPEMSVHSTNDERLPGASPAYPTAPDHRFSWPVYEGVDYSYLRNWTGWLGFFEYPDATKGYVGVYDEVQDEGVVRVFPPKIAVGAKGFATGWSDALPWTIWTDERSGGVELHGGLAPTFWDTTELPPGGSVTWREAWYPVKDLGDVTVASEEAALRVTQSSERLRLGVQPTRAWPSDQSELYVWERATCDELAHWTLLSQDPTRVYQNALSVGNRTLDEIAVAYVDADHNVLAAYGPKDCVDFVMPDPHLGYGINIRDVSRLPALGDPLGFQWVKLWEEYSGMPTRVSDYRVLYNVNCAAYVNDLNGWRTKIRQIAAAGRGSVDAYEICNEPNVKNANWGGNPPDPQRFTEMLCIANSEIKAIDPGARVVSGGLAPVGRIPPPWSCGEGNNCTTMDEQAFLQAMLDHGAASCMDAFGYHPYGFASPPGRDPEIVSNAFAFRGVESMRDILVDAGLQSLPVWATEFNWLRRPAEDGYEWCDDNQSYAPYFLWQEVTSVTQADYLVRAFQYADTHWPWMEGMFVWNLDWHDYLTWWPCAHSRYYGLRRQEGSSLGASTPAYDALVAMDKRHGLQSAPMLSVAPTRRLWLAEMVAPQVLTTSFSITNTGSGELTWTATISPTSSLYPTLAPLHGVQGEALVASVDTAKLEVGTYTATLTISAFPVDTLHTPQTVDVVLRVVEELERTYLPVITRGWSAPTAPEPEKTPVPTANPEGPSKIGVHAIGEGGTLELVQQVADAGGHVAVVKGLSFGYLCEVKRISPETVTVGRWSSHEWEAVLTEGDPAEQAREHMDEHMHRWTDYQSCVDYWEVLNEVDPRTIAGHVWLGEFFKAAMDVAETNGYKLALFSYSMGVPELYEWEAIAETGVFARAKAGGHILSLHEYGGPLMSDRWGEPMPQYLGQSVDDPAIPRYRDRGVLAGRYRHLYRDILIPRGEVIPLVITEANVAIEDPEARGEVFYEEIAWYDERLREDDYVLGMTIFTLGGVGGWDHFDYHEFLPDLAERIITLKDE